LVRGLFTAVGKTFELEKGSLEFLGGEEINPLIDLRAVNRTSDLTAVIALSGPVQNPTIALSSEPPLPQDEVLSHLLFGKASGELSTLEAVQLASALAKLSGRGGGGLGILDRMRRGLGVDVLRVESSGEGEEATTAVKAGKYVTEDVYVGVTQGATAEAGGVEVEIEVTPNISIETENRSDGQSNVGVRFKWDY
jgi:translocation and assembly module TamB